MLMILFVWKSSSKPLKKIKYKINIFWQIFYSNIYLADKQWLRVHYSSQTFKSRYD